LGKAYTYLRSVGAFSMFRCQRIGEMPLLRLSRSGALLRARFCATQSVVPPSDSPAPTTPTRPYHILYHMLKERGPLTRKQIEEQLAEKGMFDVAGHAARRRLLQNRTAVAQNNKLSTPSKPTTIPKSKLLALITEKKHHEEKVLSTKRPTESIQAFVVPSPEFKALARINRKLVFPTTRRLDAAIDHLRRIGKVEAKPKGGQTVRGRHQYVFRIKEGSTPIPTPDEFEASGRGAITEKRHTVYMERRDQRILEKKEAWASYINGEENRIGSLLDPRILTEREEARLEKQHGLKA